MKARFLGIIGSIVTLFALFSASTACFVLTYQPREPKSLKSH